MEKWIKKNIHDLKSLLNRKMGNSKTELQVMRDILNAFQSEMAS